MSAQLVAAVAAKAAGERIDVAAVCRTQGISRTKFYRYLDRYTAEGVAGMFPRSRAPRTSPTAVGPAVEDLVVRARKHLQDTGADAGALSIVDWLSDHREDHPQDWVGTTVPSRATVHRVLTRRGMITPAPAKRPRTTSRRFTADAPNRMWQMDGFIVDLATPDPAARLNGGRSCVVLHLLDDHSRLDLACSVAPSENAADVWAAFTTAATRYGLPAAVLTDNGTAFSGARRGWTSPLEAGLRALGVHPITSTPGHPQTCGKVERAHATARHWLAAHPVPTSMQELTALLEDYRDWYNHHRRHSGIARLRPAQAYALRPRIGPAGQSLPAPLRVSHHRVSASGCIGLHDSELSLGRAHAGATATCFRTGNDATIFIGNQLIRVLTIDRTRTYQPLHPHP